MGIFCPTCKTHQPIIRNVTADGGSVTPANPVLARVLGCGHTISGAAHAEYIRRCNEIRAKAFTDKAAIDDKANADMSALWEVLSAPGGV
jgi:hypothetical protein